MKLELELSFRTTAYIYDNPKFTANLIDDFKYLNQLYNDTRQVYI